MIKAVFFDLYQTLACYDPPREEIQAGILNDLGVEVNPETLRRPLAVADEFIYQELARAPLGKRAEKDKMALWVEYEGVLLKEAGIAADEPFILRVLARGQQIKMKMVPFDDVVPTLTDLKGRGLVLGLISNVDHDIASMLDEMGITPWLQIVVTSQDAGATKPHPEIFQEALSWAGVLAEEAIYVGDQYQVDMVGANRVGMKGVLLDREGYNAEVTDCPRVQSLSELVEHL